MSDNLDNSLRLSIPISEMNRQIDVNGTELFPIVDGSSAVLVNKKVDMRSIGLYLVRMISSDPAFMLPVNSIIGLSNILNNLNTANGDLEERVAQNEADILIDQTDIAILQQGPMLRVDDWCTVCP